MGIIFRPRIFRIAFYRYLANRYLYLVVSKNLNYRLMNFKLDTKEKMHVIRVQESLFSAIMADEVTRLCKSFLQQPVKNVVLDFSHVEDIHREAVSWFPQWQEMFALGNASLVFCCFRKPVKQMLEENDVLDVLNITPTESEAWDIIQMEEVERELLGD